MMRITVISAEQPSSNTAQPAVNDNFDRHNKPRLRRQLILSALNEKYPHLVSISKPPSSSPTSLNNSGFNLVDLYKIVHDERMVQFLVDAWSNWKELGPKWDVDNCLEREGNCDGVPPLIPCHSAFRRDGTERPSTNVMGAIGYYCTDMITPIVGSLVQELQEDATIICSAVDTAFAENIVVYALTTHPGHHASRDCFGGYCYLNNAALCAKLCQIRLDSDKHIMSRSSGDIVINHDISQQNAKNYRVAIIDIDYHCGNGTSSIFYNDPNVFFASIHCHPDIEYPWNHGYDDQTGVGEGEGSTLHIPLAPGATWHDTYKPALDKAMSAIVAFGPAALVVSMGLDTHDGDSVAVNRGGFKLKGSDYFELGSTMGKYLAGKKMPPVIFVQEGGYKMDTIGSAAADVLGGYATGTVAKPR